MAQIDLKTAPAHQVLATAGKQALRPGGYRATEQLFAWADFQPGETVLELAASFGSVQFPWRSATEYVWWASRKILTVWLVPKPILLLLA
ncbi:hypothetical protein SPB21_08745 [Leptothoe sp. ISB3NOV94-8A]